MDNRDLEELVNILIDIYDKNLLKKNENEVVRILNKIDSNTINNILFTYNDGVKKVDKKTINFLRECGYNMQGISFDNVDIRGCSFRGLKNVLIDINKVYNKDLSNTDLYGVKLLGDLEGAIISGTSFNGYIGELKLDPQKLKTKDLSLTSLDGVYVNGSFDDCFIFNINFKGAKGDIYINPQRVLKKDLRHIDFSGVTFVGDNDDIASFKNCYIKQTSFEGAKGDIYINPQELKSDYIMMCNFSGVTFTGEFDNITLVGNEFVGSKNAVIDLNKVSEPQIITNGNLRGVTVIPLVKKTKKRSRVLSLFSSN